MKYYEVQVSYTGKSIGSKDNFTCYDKQNYHFKTLQEAKQYIKENYSGKSREKMYIDDQEGNAKHVGYIYKVGINQDISHMTEKYYQQDWVEVREVVKTTILI